MDPSTRKALNKCLAFENVNAKFNEIIRPLRTRSTSIDEIRYAVDVGPHLPSVTLIGEAVTRGLEKTQNFKCLHCDNRVISATNNKREPMPSRICKRCDKDQH